MTKEEREDAINFFKEVAKRKVATYCKLAIEALEQEPCDDCISRQAVDELSKELVHTTRDKADFLCNFWEGLQKLPSVTPKEKTGKWISFGIQGEIDGQIVRAFTCSKCGAISIFRVSNGNIVNGDLCPNCGARMVSE